MWLSVFYIVFLLIDSIYSMVSIGSIPNATLRILDKEPMVMINVSSRHCLCLLGTSVSYFAVNHYQDDLKCEIFSALDKNGSLILRKNVPGILFLKLENRTQLVSSIRRQNYSRLVKMKKG